MRRLVDRELAKRCRGFLLNAQRTRPDPIICAKVRWPIGDVAWYIAGYDRRTYVAFGIVTGLGAPEWGYFSILSVDETRIAGIPPEVDDKFAPQLASRLNLPCQALDPDQIQQT